MAKKKEVKAVQEGKGQPGKQAGVGRGEVGVTSEVVAALVGVKLEPALEGRAVQRLVKPLPGYSSVLDDVARQLVIDGAQLNLGDLTPESMVGLQTKRAELLRKEQCLEPVYQSVYQQRLVVDDEAMRQLFRVNRRVSARQEEDPDLYARWSFLRDYIGAFRPGRNPPPSSDASDGSSSDPTAGSGADSSSATSVVATKPARTRTRSRSPRRRGH